MANIWKRPPADPVTLPLAIEDIRYDSGKNTVTLDITGTLGADYSLEVSHDLTRWEGTKITTAPASRFSITIDAPSGATKAYFPGRGSTQADKMIRQAVQRACQLAANQL